MKFRKIKIPQAEWDKATQDKFAKWEQTNLTEEERLGLAYCRFNCWQWDDIFCPCPEGFYDLPRFSDKPGVLTREKYIRRPRKQIKEYLGEAKTSMYWWKFALGRSESEWREWYFVERLEEERRSQALWNIARSVWFFLLGSALSLWIMRLIR